MLVGNSNNPVVVGSILTKTDGSCSGIESSVRYSTSPKDGLWPLVVVETEDRIESSSSELSDRRLSSVVWRCTLSGSVSSA